MYTRRPKLSFLVALAYILVIVYASLQPFQGLKRAGVLASASTLSASVVRCGATAWGQLVVRAWPQAIGALISEGKSYSFGADVGRQSALRVANLVRNVTLALRDEAAGVPRWAAGGTFAPSAGSLVELFFGASGAEGHPLPLGKRTPTVYRVENEGVSAAIETLPSGPVAITVGDSEDSLSWAYRTATLMPGQAPAVAAPTPLLALFFDGVQLAQLVPALKLGAQQERTVRELLLRLRRVDGQVIADRDLFRLTVRAPVKQ